MSNQSFVYPNTDEIATQESEGVTVRYAVFCWYEYHLYIAAPTFWYERQPVDITRRDKVVIPTQPFHIFMNAEWGWDDKIDYFIPSRGSLYYQLDYLDFCKVTVEWDIRYTWAFDRGWAFFRKDKSSKLAKSTIGLTLYTPIELIIYTDAVRIHPRVSYEFKPITSLD